MLGSCPGSVGLQASSLKASFTKVTEAGGFFIEFFGTLFLVLTVLATTNPNRKHQPSYLQPLSIGLAIFCLHMFMVSLTYLHLHTPG